MSHDSTIWRKVSGLSPCSKQKFWRMRTATEVEAYFVTAKKNFLAKFYRQIIPNPAALRPSPQDASVNSASTNPSLVFQVPVARLSRRKFVRWGPSSRRGTFGVLGFLVACAPGDQPPIVSASVPPSREHSGGGVSGRGRIEGPRGCKRVIRDQAQCRHQA